MKVLVTGCAGFIGMHTCLRLLARGDDVIGLDNLNDYYDVRLKGDRLARLREFDGFSFHKLDMTDQAGVAALFAGADIQGVVHLAAQPGVRYSLKNPHAYIQSNLVGFTNILEGCRHHQIEHWARPIITTDNVGCREAVDVEVSGFLCKMKDADDLARKMERFIDLPFDTRAEMGCNGRKKMESEFNEQIVIDCYLDVIGEIVKQDHGK